MEHKLITKLLLTIPIVLAELLGMIPYDVQRLSTTALCLLLLDLFLGFTVACRNGKLASRIMTEGTLKKFISYAAIVALGHIFAVSSGSWNWVLAAWGAICACEFSSVAENVMIVIRQAEQGGARLGPLIWFLQRIEPMFAFSRQSPSTAIAITKAKEEPEIVIASGP